MTPVVSARGFGAESDPLKTIDVIPLSPTEAEYVATVKFIQETFAIVRAREKARVESLRADKVVPHERGEE